VNAFKHWGKAPNCGEIEVQHRAGTLQFPNDYWSFWIGAAFGIASA
jgi:hypothetical protein